MTLNMTVLTRYAIYQSADFRLTSMPANAVIEDSSAKIVQLTSSSWIGFITYTGVGKWNGQDVSQLVVDWLADGVSRSMTETAAVLESEGAKLLGEVKRRSTLSVPHSFTIAGFEDRIAHAFVVSNFEDSYGNSWPVQSTLSTSTRRVRRRSGAAVIATGAANAVPVHERRVLAKLASLYPDDGGRIRRKMESMNAAAARSPLSQNLVSVECAVSSFRSDGFGIVQVSEAAAGNRPQHIPTVMAGLDLNALMISTLGSSGIDMSNAQLVSATSVSTTGYGPPGRIESTCQFGVVESGSDCTHTIAEISMPGIDLQAVQDINNSGHMVGHGVDPEKPFTTLAPWILRGDQLIRPDCRGYGQGINNASQAALVVTTDKGSRAGIYYNDTTGVFNLDNVNNGDEVGVGSFAKKISNTGIVAGTVNTRMNLPGQMTSTAAVFSADWLPRLFDRVGAAQNAVDINDSGQVLVSVSMTPFELRPVLWNLADDSWLWVGGGARSVRAMALADDGTVLGNSADPTVALVCKPGGVWQELGTEVGWSANDMNEQGDVVGVFTHERMLRPWFRSTSGQVEMLPFIAGHHTEAKAINLHRQIAGGASADHGGHAVIWTRR